MGFARLTKAVSLLDSEESGDELLRTFLTCSSRDAGADMSALYVLQDDQRALVPAMTVDVPAPYDHRLSAVRWGEGACGRAASTNLPVVIVDTARENDAFAADLGPAMGIRALYATPVPAGDGRPLGVVAQLYRTPHRPSANELTLSGLYSRLLATVIERERMHDPKDVRDALKAQRHAELLAHARHVAQHAISAHDEILAIVAHDLRNLVATVKLSATMLTRTNTPQDDRRRGRKQVDIILRTTDRMHRLVNDLLDGAAIETGHFSISKARCSVRALLQAAVEIGQPLAEERELRLVCEPPPHEIELFCDEQRIVQVLRNLIENAVKFTPRGTITVRAWGEAARVGFAVADEGVGISREQLPHIFERFWTADGRHGTGLGLHIAKSIVEAHHGELHVESVRGHGSTFSFTIALTE